MKIKIIKVFKGSTSNLPQSSIWIKLEQPTNPPVLEGFNLVEDTVDNIINLYSYLQRQSKIIVSNKYHVFDDDIISICYTNFESSKLTLQAIENICNVDDINSVLQNLKLELQQFSEFGQNNAYFLNDSLEIGIPICKYSSNVYHLGTGQFTQKISSTSTKSTSVIGVNLVKNKLQTSQLLKQHGLPGSDCVLVASLEEAINIANYIGYPVVVKPNDRDNGDGVFAGIRNQKQLEFFYQKSRSFSNNILIEKHVEGFGHRITIINDKIVSHTKKLPWGITGDGHRKVSEILTEVDDEILSMLEDQNLNLDSVIDLDRFIPLRRKNNASANGQTIGLNLEDIHPDNIQLAFTISHIFDLDIVGVDLIIKDISKSWLESKCVIPDINAIPQIGFDRVKTIFYSLFPNGFRSPMYLLVVNNINYFNLDKLKSILHFNAYSTVNGVWINDKQVSNLFNNGYDSARSMIFNSRVKSGLVVMTEEGIRMFGLPLDKFSGVILDTQSDNDIEKILFGQNIITING